MENRYRSLFWPILLIGVGVIWLLANLGLLQVANLVVLWRLWPLLLIAAGLDLLFGRRAPVAGALIGLATLAVVILLLLAAPRLRWADTPEVKTERFSEPAAGATSARVVLDLWSDPATVSAVENPANLFEAEITHTGRVDFQASGEQQKSIRLSHAATGGPFFWFDVVGNRRAEIGLSPQIPMDLTIDIGSGSANLDLSGLNLTGLRIEGGSGSAEVTLPAGGQALEGSLRSTSGSWDLIIPEGAQGSLRLDTGSGSVNIDLPDEAAVRVEVRDSGSGSLRLPSSLVQVEQNGDEEGVWETPGFAEADQQLVLLFEDVGSGSINIQE